MSMPRHHCCSPFAGHFDTPCASYVLQAYKYLHQTKLKMAAAGKRVLYGRTWLSGEGAFEKTASLLPPGASGSLVVGHNPTRGERAQSLLWTSFNTPGDAVAFRAAEAVAAAESESTLTFSEAPLAHAPSRLAFLVSEQPLYQRFPPDSVVNLLHLTCDDFVEVPFDKKAAVLAVAGAVLTDFTSILGCTPPLTLKDCAISFAETSQIGRQFRFVLATAPLLASQVYRDTFLQRALNRPIIKQLVSDGVVKLEQYYKYGGAGVPLLFCPAEKGHAERRSLPFGPMPPDELGLDGDESLAAEAEAESWSEALLQRHCFTFVPPGAARAVMAVPTSADALLASLGEVNVTTAIAALALFDKRRGRASPLSRDDIFGVLTTPSGFDLKLQPRENFICVGGARHAPGGLLTLRIDHGRLCVTCHAGPRHDAHADDIPIVPFKGAPSYRAAARTGHGDCCCVAWFGHVPRPVFVGTPPQIRAPTVVQGVEYEASLKRDARKAFHGFGGGDRERSVTVSVSPCGTGKTFSYGDAIVEHVLSERRAGRKYWVVIICSHVILVDDVVDQVSKKLAAAGLEGAKHYARFEEKRTELFSGVVVICAPSTHHLLGGFRQLTTKRDSPRLVVVCDELVAALNMIPTLKTKNKMEPDHVLRNLCDVFVHSDILIICDANADHTNVGAFLLGCDIANFRFVKTNALPFKGQEVRHVIPVERRLNDTLAVQPWYAAVVLDELVKAPGRPSVFVPVSTKKCGQVLHNWLIAAHPDVQVYFLHGKSDDKPGLLNTFKTLVPADGLQVVFIASPALVTGVSQDTGMFSEVLEVLAAWSTSANDSEQRKDRPRFKPALMAKPPRVTTVLVDATVAFANVPGVRVEKCVRGGCAPRVCCSRLRRTR